MSESLNFDKIKNNKWFIPSIVFIVIIILTSIGLGIYFGYIENMGNVSTFEKNTCLICKDVSTKNLQFEIDSFSIEELNEITLFIDNEIILTLNSLFFILMNQQTQLFVYNTQNTQNITINNIFKYQIEKLSRQLNNSNKYYKKLLEKIIKKNNTTPLCSNMYNATELENRHAIFTNMINNINILISPDNLNSSNSTNVTNSNSQLRPMLPGVNNEINNLLIRTRNIIFDNLNTIQFNLIINSKFNPCNKPQEITSTQISQTQQTPISQTQQTPIQAQIQAHEQTIQAMQAMQAFIEEYKQAYIKAMQEQRDITPTQTIIQLQLNIYTQEMQTKIQAYIQAIQAKTGLTPTQAQIQEYGKAIHTQAIQAMQPKTITQTQIQAIQ
jgi:hypothetical protein